MTKTLPRPRFRRRHVAGSAILLALGLVAFSTRVSAKEPKAEIKLFVADDKIDEVSKQVQEGFAKGAPKKHRIYFFDTRAQDLYGNANGPVILRARQKESKPQSTVKFRRDERDPELEETLGKISSKLEIETEFIVGKKGKPGISYALDAKPDRELSQLEGARGEELAAWFSVEQKQFLKAAGVNVDWGKLKVFGPIDADVWQWTESDKRVDTDITTELWPLGNRRILELSCKKQDGELDRQVSDFVAFFQDHNIRAAENPESKTKQALDYFAAHPTKSPEPAATAPARQ
jgi:hypothetical protein